MQRADRLRRLGCRCSIDVRRGAHGSIHRGRGCAKRWLRTRRALRRIRRGARTHLFGFSARRPRRFACLHRREQRRGKRADGAEPQQHLHISEPAPKVRTSARRMCRIPHHRIVPPRLGVRRTLRRFQSSCPQERVRIDLVTGARPPATRKPLRPVKSLYRERHGYASRIRPRSGAGQGNRI